MGKPRQHSWLKGSKGQLSHAEYSSFKDAILTETQMNTAVHAEFE